jgi:ABC-type transport system involved in cytochrome c biogenesis permease subunit
MLFVSYSLFTLGAVCALLYLVRTNLPTAVLGGAQAAISALMLALIGGGRLLYGATFEMAPGWVHQVQSKLHAGKLLDVTTAVHFVPPGSDKPVKYFTAVPGVGPFLLGALALFVVGVALYWRQQRRGEPEQGVSAHGYKVIAAGFGLLTVGLALLVYRIVAGHEITLPADIRLAPGEHGPFKLSIASNYALGLVALVWGTTLGFLLTTPLRQRISDALPDPRKLEDITYRLIIAGWPLLTIGVVMGGMWANEAWGRFWGWDPKETWALITWVVYAGYLHTRITLGWAGKRPAAIAVFGFAVVIFTFMGVNLGLTGDGLHTYGAG